MIELLNRKYQNGDTVTIQVKVDASKKGLIVSFIQSNYSDNNKWSKKQVLTDMFITRCKLANAYSKLDPTGKQTIRYIKENFSDDLSVIDEIKGLSKKCSKVFISLPTSTYPYRKGVPTDFRRCKDTFLPLIVRIGDINISKAFMDFDVFGSDAVNTAYEVLINGKTIHSTNDLINLHEAQLLHKEYFGESDDISTAEVNY